MTKNFINEVFFEKKNVMIIFFIKLIYWDNIVFFKEI